MKTTIGVLALIAGFYCAASPPTVSVAATTETKSPPPLLSMADVLASPNLLVAMGQVAERDNYNLGEFLKREGVKISKDERPEPAKPDPSKVDKRLTAEQVYSANQTAPTMWLFDASPNPSPPTFTIDPDKLSASERAKLPGLKRVHEMALLTLYKTRCGYPSSLKLNVITGQFAELPQKLQDISLTDESRAIKARAPYDNAKSQIHIPGGWTWFCDVMPKRVADRDEYSGMFTTAMEMRR